MLVEKRWFSWLRTLTLATLATLACALSACSSQSMLADSCSEGTHSCAGVCVDNAAIESCGTSCTPCPAAANGDAICEAGVCGIKCNVGALLCDGACAVCPGSTGVQGFRCEAGKCVASCAQDFAPCDKGCCAVDVGVVLTNTGAASPSIAIDSKQNPHVSFLQDHYTLMYAHRDSGPWQVSMIDAKTGNANYSTSIAVAAGDLPIVAYTSNYSVRVARYSGSAWMHETVYQSSRGYGPQIAGRALALDSAGRPHIVASQVYNESSTYNSYLLHIYFDGTRWNYEHIQDVLNNRYSEPSLAIDSKDVLHVAWVSYYDAAVNYATTASGKWVTSVALKNGSCCDTAYIALNAAGTPFISFEEKAGGYAAGSRPMSTWGYTSLHADVSVVGNLAMNAAGQFHYLLRNDAGQLLHGSPVMSSWKRP